MTDLEGTINQKNTSVLTGCYMLFVFARKQQNRKFFSYLKAFA